jgi:putative transcriptional regulator
MDRTLSLPWLLVASPQLDDANFKRAVVLMIEHNANGSMGFVINRPVQTSLSDLVVTDSIKIPENVPAWYGGPVETTTGIILHKKAPDETGVGGLTLSASETSLVDLVDYSVRRSDHLSQGSTPAPGSPDRHPDDAWLYPYRFLVGYSGWGAGQIDDELRQGAWIQIPLSDELLFNTKWGSIWEAALGQVGVSPKSLVTATHQYLN